MPSTLVVGFLLTVNELMTLSSAVSMTAIVPSAWATKARVPGRLVLVAVVEFGVPV